MKRFVKAFAIPATYITLCFAIAGWQALYGLFFMAAMIGMGLDDYEREA